MAGGPDCQQALALLQDYLKQELTPELAERIAAHMQRCRHCFTHLTFEQSFITMVESKGKKTCCPNALRLKILAAIRRTTSR
jgi:anti-sigma factor (TIGR02949 family)